jgi:outer membrane protein assembly factor BamB
VGDTLRDPPDRRVAPDWRPAPGTWASAAYGPANTGHNPHASPPRRAPEADWRVDLPAGPSSLVVAAGRVYCTTRRRLVAFDAETGAVDWERPLEAPTRLTYVDGRLYLTNTDEEIAALAPDGAEQWLTAVDAESIKGVHERSGYVFLGTFSGHRVLHADTGRVVRSRDVEWEFVASAGGAVHVTRGGPPGTPVTYDVNGRRLTERWRVDTDCGVGRPVVADGRVYYDVDPEFTPDCDGRHRVWAHEPTGERLWTASFAGKVRYPAAAGDRLFVPAASAERDAGSLVCLGPDGERRWSHETAGGVGPPAVAGGAVYAGPRSDDRAPLVAVDAATGDRLWERPVSGDVCLAAVGERLYVGDRQGVVALRG